MMDSKSDRLTMLRDSFGHWVYLILPVGLFVVFYLIPIAGTVTLSFTDWNGISRSADFVGFDNYAALLHQSRFHNAVLNNLAWLAFYLLAPSSLGLLLALILDRGLRFEGFFRIVYFLPFTVPAVSVAAIWRWMYEPSNGLVTTVLRTVGMESWAQNWLGDPAIVTYSLMGSILWWTTGFAFLIFFAGLRNIPVELVEAAKVEGATPWQTFWRVTFPMLWPSTIIVLGLAAIDAMRLFDIIWATTNGGPAYASEVMAVMMYDLAFGRLEMGRASAVSVYLLLVAGLVIIPYIVYMSRRVAESETS
jgi:ABC-type sugar transport system permease subunit